MFLDYQIILSQVGGEKGSGRRGDAFAIGVQHIWWVKVGNGRWSILGLGNSSVGHWGGEVLGEVLAKVSGLPTLGGSKWRAGSRRYLVERVTRIVPGTVFCTPNFRRLLQRKCPKQVLGPKVRQCLVCRLQGEYVSNLLIAWFCTGCGSGMGLRLLPRIMETSAESSL